MKARDLLIIRAVGLISFSAVLLVGCAPGQAPSKRVRTPHSMAILLAPHIGDGKLDSEIRKLQQEVRVGRSVDVSLERLGWVFVSKARETFDPGYYKLAEQCALALDHRHPRCAEALLLHGHVLHNLHKFKEAEVLARELISKRHLPFDFGLLSDLLMEQGKLEEAFDACQTMIDLRPDVHSYARGAHLRWLRGDLNGAQELMRRAADAASPQDAESAAWVYTRLAGYQFQAGSTEAEESCAAALEFRPNYPPALLMRGRLLLAAGGYEQACECLLRAAESNPLPEYQWALAEALRAAGHVREAGKVESDLSSRGASADPRTFALYLATQGKSIDLAVRLAREELDSRMDVFTRDTLAWALVSAGRLDEAQIEMNLALAQGTQDARLFLHAATLAHKNRHMEEAEYFTVRAGQFKQTLLPSERVHLDGLRDELAILGSAPRYTSINKTTNFLSRNSCPGGES